MISVSKQDVTKALREIDQQGILSNNRSRGYCLSEKYHYPPKEVLRRAYRIANGRPIRKLHGGPQTNTPLRQAGFEVIQDCGCGNTCKII